MRTFAKAICCILVILLIAFIAGFIYKYTNGFNETLKTFYVEYDGKQILSSDSKMTLGKDKVHRFDVKYTFDKEDAEPKDYKVKIVPNITRDFDYTVDGERYLFSKLGELTDVFAPAKQDKYFELSIADDLTFGDVLKKAHGGNSISVPQDAFTNNPYPFRLQISSYNDEITYNIDFTFDSKAISSSGQPEEDSGQSTPQEHSYSIEYTFNGEVSNLSDISINGIKKAKAGEQVTFEVVIGDSQFSVTGGHITALGGDSITVELKRDGNKFSFTMPEANIFVFIDVQFTSDRDVTLYSISYDSLGRAGMGVVDLKCQDKAEAEEAVTFTASIKPEYATQYRISSIAVYYGSGEEYIGDLTPDGDAYSFVMPDAATMEQEENEGYVYLLFYIMFVDE